MPPDKTDGAETSAPDPFAAFRSIGDAWVRGGQALTESGQKLFGDFAKAATGGMATFAGASSSGEAQTAYAAAAKAATDLSASLARMFPTNGAANGDGSLASFLPAVFDPQAWAAPIPGAGGIPFAQLMEGPQLADTGHVERKFAAVVAANEALRQRGVDHQTVMMQAWARAAGEFSRRLSERTATGTTPSTWREATGLWLQVANDELIATQRTDAYLQSQRALLKASTDLRLAQQDVAAFYGDMFGLPSRIEMDDVHKTLTELRREVRVLRSRAAAQQR